MKILKEKKKERPKEKQKEKQKENIKTFLCSLAGTSLIITLFAGLIIVEKNTRAVAFGDNSPFLIYEHENFKPKFLKLHFMGKDYTILKKNIY